jgi:hypothetical protein
MKPAPSQRWAESPSSQRREPTGGELAGGFPCGPADQALFNELMFRLTDMITEAAGLVTASGLVANESTLTQVLQSVRSQRVNFLGTAGGTANALTLSPTPAFADIADLVGVPIRFLVATGNTAAASLNVNGLGAKAITRPNGAALKIGDLVPGQLIEVAYTGSVFHILSMGASDALPTSTVIFTTPGTSNFTVPSGIYRLRVEVLGAGGGGGGGSSSSSGFGGSGGGAGGFAQKLCAVTPGQVIAVTVGAGGVAGISPSTGGGAGGSSSFGSFCSATGGQGGVTASGAAVNGGSGSSGDLNFQGSDGKTSIIMVGPQPRGGDGGESRYGGGGSGSAVIGTPGLAGKGYGAGAGGGGEDTNGGIGAPGLVIVQY